MGMKAERILRFLGTLMLRDDWLFESPYETFRIERLKKGRKEKWDFIVQRVLSIDKNLVYPKPIMYLLLRIRRIYYSPFPLYFKHINM